MALEAAQGRELGASPEIHVPRDQRAALEAVKRRFGLEANSTDFRSLLIAQARKIRANEKLSVRERSMIMSEFSAALGPFLRKLEPFDRIRIQHFMAESVIALEQFPRGE